MVAEGKEAPTSEAPQDKSCKGMFVDLVNPKFKNFSKPLFLAVIVGVFTFGATLGLAMHMLNQCDTFSFSGTPTQLASLVDDGDLSCIESIVKNDVFGKISGADGVTTRQRDCFFAPPISDTLSVLNSARNLNPNPYNSNTNFSAVTLEAIRDTMAGAYGRRIQAATPATDTSPESHFWDPQETTNIGYWIDMRGPSDPEDSVPFWRATDATDASSYFEYKDCVDMNPNCHQWNTTCDIPLNAMWMWENCKVTCGLCTQEAYGAKMMGFGKNLTGGLLVPNFDKRPELMPLREKDLYCKDGHIRKKYWGEGEKEKVYAPGSFEAGLVLGAMGGPTNMPSGWPALQAKEFEDDTTDWVTKLRTRVDENTGMMSDFSNRELAYPFHKWSDADVWADQCDIVTFRLQEQPGDEFSIKMLGNDPVLKMPVGGWPLKSWHKLAFGDQIVRGVESYLYEPTIAATYKVCPDFITTWGAAFGWMTVIEACITIIAVLLCMPTGVIAHQNTSMISFIKENFPTAGVKGLAGVMGGIGMEADYEAFEGGPEEAEKEETKGTSVEMQTSNAMGLAGRPAMSDVISTRI